MRVLVTGATGFIGNHVIQTLLDAKHEIIASSRTEPSEKEYSWKSKVTYIPWTIGEECDTSLFSHFQEPDLCIHLAWDGLKNFKDSNHEDLIFRNHLTFLECLIQGGIKKITTIGTCLEYGMQEGELEETMKAKPKLSYPIGKNKLREALEKLQGEHTFHLDWIRLFYMYGEGQNPKSILALLESHINQNKTVFDMSPGEQKRDYLPVKKVAELITKLALINRGSGIVNCCSGQPIKIVQLVQDYIEKRESTIQLNLGHYPYPDYEPFEFWGSTKKLDRILLNNDNS